jgi:hypothetical protein
MWTVVLILQLRRFVKRFLSALVVIVGLLTTSHVLRVVHAAERLDLRVSPSVSIAPAQVVVRAIVEHDPENRELEIVADSLDFYRRTVVDLDGEQAPKTTELRLLDIPGGEYNVSATLTTVHGAKMTVRRSVTVMAGPALLR